jgi:macrolide transport system ATP-binding/permease protein
MGAWVEDIRYGLRVLRHSPLFTGIVVMLLALGIGANTAIFSVVNAVMLGSLPVRNAEQLVLLRWRARSLPNTKEYSSFGDCGGKVGGANPAGCSFPLRLFEQLRSGVNAFSGMAAFAGPADLRLGQGGTTSIVSGQVVSGDFFSTLGVNPILGRLLGPADDSISASPSVVLSYAFWQSAFGADRSIPGRSILLNDVAFTVVGVAEPAFTNLSPGKTQDLWLPIAIVPRLGISWGRNIEGLNNWWLVVLARLKPASSLEQAEAAASLVFRNEIAQNSTILKESDSPQIVFIPAQEGLSGSRTRYSTQLYVLMIAVWTFLLVTCANVAGLLLSRSANRRKEIAIRLALGAQIPRIIRQLLIESAMLSLFGGAIGVIFAYGGIRITTVLISYDSHRSFPFAVVADWRVLLFALCLSIVCGIVFGMIPAFNSTRIDLRPTLNEMTGVAAGCLTRKVRVASALAVAQVALSFVILIGAGLLERTLNNLRNINPGFDTRNLLLFEIDPSKMDRKSRMANLYSNLRERLATLPGVVSVTYSSDSLLSGGLWTSSVRIEGKPEDSESDVDMFAAGPDFFSTMRIPLLSGRLFSSEDFEDAVGDNDGASEASGRGDPQGQSLIPVLVNQTFARWYLADQNPLGKRIIRGNSERSTGGTGVSHPRSRHWQIVGVVGDFKDDSLRRDIHPTVYLPLTSGTGYFELRTAVEPTLLVPSVRRVITEANANSALSNIRSQTEQIDDLLLQERLLVRIGAVLGLLTLVLACLGLYGLLSYDVTRRTYEIGIRMALGAQRSDVLQMVVREGLLLISTGVIVGAAAATIVTRYLTSLLYGIKPLDIMTFTIVPIILLSIALAACYLPARRATSVEPSIALREQ